VTGRFTTSQGVVIAVSCSIRKVVVGNSASYAGTVDSGDFVINESMAGSGVLELEDGRKLQIVIHNRGDFISSGDFFS